MQAPVTRGRLGARSVNSLGLVGAPQVINNLPLVVDLQAYEGDDLFVDITVNNPDGSPTDLSHATVTAQVRTSPNALDILANFEVVVASNQIHLQLPSAQSQLLILQTAWDCQMSIAGVVTTLAAGTIYSTPDVTR